jgi:antitoxin VapB
MGLNIKNPEIEAEIRALAAATGESLTEAIAQAVRERRARLAAAPDDRQRAEKLAAIAALQGALRDFPAAHRTSDHDDLYDEHGLPK